jgi:UDP-N-acetylglucosamine--N-acetylmuramyl-(pentapeptide) pyrophosphoryl-undecaprenol N-acetylglucosamine transferase
MVPQPEFTPALLAERLSALLPDPDALAAAAGAAARLAQPAAARRLADLVLHLVRSRAEQVPPR